MLNLQKFINKFYELGGVVRIEIYPHNEAIKPSITTHANIAKTTLLKAIKYENNRLSNFGLDCYLNENFNQTGTKISPQEFIGDYDIKNKKLLTNITQSGLAWAILEPPYKLAVKDKEKFFNEFCDTLFDDISKLEIYKYNTNCSNYFDNGNEWWGTFFYSVYNPKKSLLLGIVASSTD